MEWHGTGKAKWWGTYIDTTQMELVNIFYSQDDEGYIACLVRMPTLSAFGETPNKAMAEIATVIELSRQPDE